ncbi:MAG: selenide, water dikinase SelD [Deltaproteobacteria bacterium]|nr:selenide, water dikinase SelD [Deltaproteobacteria bacterium]MBW2444859.1 selenide, water dikinase SelD [Deltaproteobacteria bacterium]
MKRVERPAHLVLVGAGHAHVQVLRRIMMEPIAGVQVTLVVDRPEAVYSGMVPGHMSGDYDAAALEIDAVPLARRARARVVLAAATRVDPTARRIELAGRPALTYDVASLNVGSTVKGLDVPGMRDHALATRPVRTLIDTLEGRIARARAGRGDEPLRVTVVGAGAAGFELAFAVLHRLTRDGVAAELSLVCEGPQMLPGAPRRVAARALRLAQARGIHVRTELRVERVEKDSLHMAGPAGTESLPCDLALWATGGAPFQWLRDSPLPLEANGFVRVRDTLQVVGHDDLFAVGDCAVLDAHPWMPRAGVHAVREGPTLERNLRARLAGTRLRRHRPQRDFLMLLNLGGGRALGAKWGLSAEGHAVWRLKDAIDRRFMARFRVLDANGSPAPAFPSGESMGMEAMECGGCAAKVGARPLESALARLPKAPDDPLLLAGLDPPDDAAVLALPAGEVALATVDGFRAFADDPWWVGRVAAVNAVSDVLAKGGTPRHALALVTVPEAAAEGEEELLHQVLAGVRAALDPLGVTLAGGHTSRGPELFVGLSILGHAGSADAVLPLGGARPGDTLILTQPLGTGVLLAADMQGRAAGRWVETTYGAMARSNQAAARVAIEVGVHASTDVSGFGLAGHLGEMLAASGAGAQLRLAHLPLLPGAQRLFEMGIRSSVHTQNVENTAGVRLDPKVARDANAAAVFDPQTSGGLLFAVAEESSEALLEALHAAGDRQAACIGRVLPAFTDGTRIELAP